MAFYQNVHLLQLLLASLVIYIIYIASLVILNINSIVITNFSKVIPDEIINIVDGYASASYLSTKSFNTYNTFASNFKKIGKSVNTRGGAQFSYQFWIKIDDTTESNFNNLILLLKGDNRKYQLVYYDPNIQTTDITLPQQVSDLTINDFIIGCPIIKFKDSYTNLNVTFNTINNPLTSIDITMNKTVSQQTRRNVLSLLPLDWYLFTFVFQDNYDPLSSFENGIQFQFWVNDFSVQINNASDTPSLRGNTLKQNDGDLFLFPNLTNNNNFMSLGNIKYFNFALKYPDISKTFKEGPPKYKIQNTTTNADKPAFITAYNKVELYNY